MLGEHLRSKPSLKETLEWIVRQPWSEGLAIARRAKAGCIRQVSSPQSPPKSPKIAG